MSHRLKISSWIIPTKSTTSTLIFLFFYSLIKKTIYDVDDQTKNDSIVEYINIFLIIIGWLKINDYMTSRSVH